METAAPAPPVPFRCDVRGRPAVGGGLGRRAPSYPRFEDDLVRLSARVLAASGDGDLVFVGRSPESLFDHLRGALSDTSWRERLRLLPLSLWHEEEDPARERLLRGHLRRSGLTLDAILRSRRATTFVDLVASGATFGCLLAIYERWCRDQGIDVGRLRARLAFVCIVDCPPGTWEEDAGWPQRLPRGDVRSLTVRRELWSYLADQQWKTMPSFGPDRWDDPRVARPERTTERRRALRLAREVHQLGCARRRRAELVRRLVSRPEIRERWLRDLVRELRR